MNKQTKILALLSAGAIAIYFILWRNYGVKAKGEIILDDKNKTNEQKELVNKIKNTNPKEGDEIKTSFGYYKLSNGNWIKTKEIWE